MTRDEVLRLARQSGCPDPMVFSGCLERFAVLVAAAEREECAKVCDEESLIIRDGYHSEDRTAANIAAAIRARGAA